jgi:hypothetical protein
MLATSLTSRDAGLPVEGLRALDWLNFFLAALLMGFGPFVAVHLAENGWAPASIGAMLKFLRTTFRSAPVSGSIAVVAKPLLRANRRHSTLCRSRTRLWR